MKKLYIKQKVFKFLDHYPVTDENQNEKYQVDQSFRMLGFRVDVSKSTGEPVFSVEKEVFAFLPRYHVTFEGGGEYTVQSQFRLFKTALDIEGLEETINLEGDLFDLDFEVTANGRTVGRIAHQWLSWGDTYEIEVIEPGYELFLLSLFLCVDQIKDQKQNS